MRVHEALLSAASARGGSTAGGVPRPVKKALIALDDLGRVSASTAGDLRLDVAQARGIDERPRLIGQRDDPGRRRSRRKRGLSGATVSTVAQVRHATHRPWEIRLLARASRRVKG